MSTQRDKSRGLSGAELRLRQCKCPGSTILILDPKSYPHLVTAELALVSSLVGHLGFEVKKGIRHLRDTHTHHTIIAPKLVEHWLNGIVASWPMSLNFCMVADRDSQKHVARFQASLHLRVIIDSKESMQKLMSSSFLVLLREWQQPMHRYHIFESQ